MLSVFEEAVDSASTRHWTVLIWSTIRLAPVVSRPKHHIFSASVWCPLEVVHQAASTPLGVITRSDLSVFNLVSGCVLERLGSHEDAAVLVGTLGETSSVALPSDGLSEGDDELKLDDLDCLLQ